MIGLIVVSVSFFAFATEYVHRVTNNLWGDVAFSGWTSAIGHLLAAGGRIYRDFTLPLPPGSFALLALIERLSGGGAKMIHETWVCACCVLALTWLAYAIARRLASPETALFVAAGTLAWICGWAKELAYDYLAEVGAYAGILVLLDACNESPRDPKRRRFFAVGLAAGFTLFFKQSTGVGVLAAALSALAYLALVERREQGALRTRTRDALACIAGSVTGIAACVAAVLALNGSVSGFFTAVFVDGPLLKGGAGFLLRKTAAGFAFEQAAGLSLAQIAVVVAITYSGLARGTPREGSNRANRFAVVSATAISAAAFCFATLWLATEREVVPFPSRWIRLSYAVVESSVALAVVVFFANALSSERKEHQRTFNVAAVSTLVLASAVSGSLPNFRPFEEANATIIVVLVALFSLLEAGRLRCLRPVALAALMVCPLASKLPRSMMASTPADPAATFWKGLRVNEGGLEVLEAAERARDTAGPNGTVLVLPEDPSLAMLIGRRRPPLCGAVVFVDQYPERCVLPDLTYLDRHPPDVLVVHPAHDDWLPIFRTWNGNKTPAEKLMDGFVLTHIFLYHHDSTYHTAWADRGTTLDVWVRN